MVYILFEFLARESMLNKMQLLCRDMYFNKVPLFYKKMSFFFRLPKVPVEDMFVNMAYNMNTETHQYLCNVPYVMTVVSDKVFAGVHSHI